MKREAYREIDIETAQEALYSFLLQYFPDDSARICTDALMWAELRGIAYQGTEKLLGTEPIQTATNINSSMVSSPSRYTRLIDGKKNPSYVLAEQAMQEIEGLVRQHDLGFVGITNFFTSLGPLGYYAERLSEQGLICFVMSRSPGIVAPFGSTSRLFGTNPIAIGIPSSDRPFVVDFSTSAVIWSQVIASEMNGEELPENSAVRSDGSSTRDPKDVLQGGALLPFLSKSNIASSLSLLVETLAGPLLGSVCCDRDGDKEWGALFSVFHPRVFGSEQDFEDQMSKLISEVRDSNQSVRLPGDRTHAEERKRQGKGTVFLHKEVVRLLGLG